MKGLDPCTCIAPAMPPQGDFVFNNDTLLVKSLFYLFGQNKQFDVLLLIFLTMYPMPNILTAPVFQLARAFELVVRIDILSSLKLYRKIVQLEIVNVKSLFINISPDEYTGHLRRLMFV